jgi:hypothetical protein
MPASKISTANIFRTTDIIVAQSVICHIATSVADRVFRNRKLRTHTLRRAGGRTAFSAGITPGGIQNIPATGRAVTGIPRTSDTVITPLMNRIVQATSERTANIIRAINPVDTPFMMRFILAIRDPITPIVAISGRIEPG